MDRIKILGLGLMCLDVVHHDNLTKIMSGGSCANVISVLSQVGLDCTVMREEYSDNLERLLFNSLHDFGVKQFLYKKTKLSTPRIIELLVDSHHDFLTVCPRCGQKVLNIHMPSENDIIKKINTKLSSDYNLLYCDRTSNGIIQVMNAIHKNNGVVFYEPNSARNINSLINSAKHADIVKFSNQRISLKVANQLRDSANLKMIIITLGEDGLLFSHLNKNGVMTDWIKIKSEFNGPIVDASGAGDWLTAGFIIELVKNKLSNLACFSTEKIINMLSQGMKYSQLCCASIGAQGVFYSDDSLNDLRKLSNQHSFAKIHNDHLYESSDNTCPYCFSKIS